MTGNHATYIEHRHGDTGEDKNREIIVNGDVTVVENNSDNKISPEKYIEKLKETRRSLEYISLL